MGSVDVNVVVDSLDVDVVVDSVSKPVQSCDTGSPKIIDIFKFCLRAIKRHQINF